MKNSKTPLILSIIFAFFLLAGCSDEGGSVELSDTDIVESGTYTGTAKEVDPEEKEIYVETQDGKTLELYFTEQTQLLEDGQNVAFSSLSQGDRIEVQIERKGQRLEPISVSIL
ncbi:hypothetical protein [Pelagicoccus sp. SDUM812002]|uniref:hypothetical protein n=1 Tax=Pelagicoccus sp. SDUM812002 TaxID=3041266 RepID=UPI00280DF66B|nr:hypothetical protein [Pelagicoccus sp. SDUM812002]MDQ8184298.1 hypothetical protein [Pelagicoccus sp. SDUM812002]